MQLLALSVWAVSFAVIALYISFITHTPLMIDWHKERERLSLPLSLSLSLCFSLSLSQRFLCVCERDTFCFDCSDLRTFYFSHISFIWEVLWSLRVGLRACLCELYNISYIFLHSCEGFISFSLLKKIWNLSVWEIPVWVVYSFHSFMLRHSLFWGVSESWGKFIASQRPSKEKFKMYTHFLWRVVLGTLAVSYFCTHHPLTTLSLYS